MKTDVVMPSRPPKKRRVLEDAAQTLDVWLATWATDKKLTPSERARAQRERDRRKAEVQEVRVAVIAGREGITPPQATRIREYLEAVAATDVLLVGRASRGVGPYLAKGGSLRVVASELARDAVRDADRVVAAVKGPSVPVEKEGVWDAVRFAKHRSTPVTVLLPDGSSPRENT
jgi:hypothetical protein